MRQIFSVILAAALVFGGALFLAGYFEGIGVREEGQPEQASRRSPESDTQRTLWHCPEVESLVAGELPEIFDADSVRISAFYRDFEWTDVRLLSPYDVRLDTDSRMLSVKGRRLRCGYSKSWRTENSDYHYYVPIFLKPDLRGKIEFSSENIGLWQDLSDPILGEPEFRCPHRSPGSFHTPSKCGFYVLDENDGSAG